MFVLCMLVCVFGRCMIICIVRVVVFVVAFVVVYVVAFVCVSVVIFVVMGSLWWAPLLGATHLPFVCVCAWG